MWAAAHWALCVSASSLCACMSYGRLCNTHKMLCVCLWHSFIVLFPSFVPSVCFHRLRNERKRSQHTNQTHDMMKQRTMNSVYWNLNIWCIQIHANESRLMELYVESGIVHVHLCWLSACVHVPFSRVIKYRSSVSHIRLSGKCSVTCSFRVINVWLRSFNLESFQKLKLFFRIKWKSSHLYFQFGFF